MPSDTNPTGRQIRRAQQAAARALARLMDEASERLREMYAGAVEQLQRELAGLVDSSGRIPAAALPRAEAMIRDVFRAVAGNRDALLADQLRQAVNLGANPWQAAASAGVAPAAVADDTLAFIRAFRDANGLQLSDRLWRINRGALDRVTEAVENVVVRGHTAHQAIVDLIARGEDVPADLLSKRGLAAIENIQSRLKSSILTGEMNPYYQAERVIRTEANRAFGEVSVRAAAQHPDVTAVRFTLSPLHPRPDICDVHAEANLHGLGPGVYPIDNHPWPAHPNTFSYLVPVFGDEITDEDRRGRETLTSFIDRQPSARQNGMLGGAAKGWAWRSGHLDPRQVRTPWRKVFAGLQRKGIDIPARFSP